MTTYDTTTAGPSGIADLKRAHRRVWASGSYATAGLAAGLPRLAAVTGCRRIGRGRIAELEHHSRPSDVTLPAHPSSIVIDEVGGQDRLLRLELRSEIVAVFADGALVAAAPDLICLLDVLRGELSTLDALRPGDLVDVLVMPADAVWYSAAGLAMVGPASHGIPLDHPRRR